MEDGGTTLQQVGPLIRLWISRRKRPGADGIRSLTVVMDVSVDKTHTLDIDWSMHPDFDWNTEKNQRLVEQRGISFERIVSAIEQGGLVDVLEHPNQERYRGQKIYVVDIEHYLYLVPFVTGADGTRFLKTIIPSRKATRHYRTRRL